MSDISDALAAKAVNELRSRPREKFDSLHHLLNQTLLDAGRIGSAQINGLAFAVVRVKNNEHQIAEWLLPPPSSQG